MNKPTPDGTTDERLERILSLITKIRLLTERRARRQRLLIFALSVAVGYLVVR